MSKKSHTMKSDNGSLGESFQTVGTEHKWEGQEIEVKSDPLVNDGTGKPIVMRFFEFKISPDMAKLPRPSNQELFNVHAMQIKSFLWRDGLMPLEIMEPRIIWSKKKDGFRIMVTCEPKPGVVLVESTQTLQEITKTNG